MKGRAAIGLLGLAAMVVGAGCTFDVEVPTMSLEGGGEITGFQQVTLDLAGNASFQEQRNRIKAVNSLVLSLSATNDSDTTTYQVAVYISESDSLTEGNVAANAALMDTIDVPPGTAGETHQITAGSEALAVFNNALDAASPAVTIYMAPAPTPEPGDLTVEDLAIDIHVAAGLFRLQASPAAGIESAQFIELGPARVL